MNYNIGMGPSLLGGKNGILTNGYSLSAQSLTSLSFWKSKSILNRINVKSTFTLIKYLVFENEAIGDTLLPSPSAMINLGLAYSMPFIIKSTYVQILPLAGMTIIPGGNLTDNFKYNAGVQLVVQSSIIPDFQIYLDYTRHFGHARPTYGFKSVADFDVLSLGIMMNLLWYTRAY